MFLTHLVRYFETTMKAQIKDVLFKTFEGNLTRSRSHLY